MLGGATEVGTRAAALGGDEIGKRIGQSVAIARLRATLRCLLCVL